MQKVTKKENELKQLAVLVDQYHKQLLGSSEAKALLKERWGLGEDIIVRFSLGYDGRNFVIPIPDKSSQFSFLKYRKDPLDNSDSAKYWYTAGSSVELYGWEHIRKPRKRLVICEGEFKRLILEANGISAITQTSGAGTFSDEHVEQIKGIFSEIIICYDNDPAGIKGAIKLGEKLPKARFVLIPKLAGVKDINDFISKQGINELRKLLNSPKSLKEFKEEVLIANITEKKALFPPISLDELTAVLGLTIKKDDDNKIITFLCQLLAYTKKSQFNISFNAPSSAGKTFIPLEIASLFPFEDIIIVGYCSPTAFFHDVAEYDGQRKIYVVDLSRKILIFLDQPHTLLLEHLRPLLSHDKEEISVKITDKTKNAGMRTKTIVIKGFPVVIFCTARLITNDQEATRLFMMSPEMDQEKFRQAIFERIRKETDFQAYVAALESNLQRQALKERIRAIKEAHIDDIKIKSPEKIKIAFLEKRKILKPRHARDISRVLSMVKSLALLNLWYRDIEGNTLIANDEDIEQALRLWDSVSYSQELNLSPYVYQFYLDVFVPLSENHKGGITRQSIIKRHFELYERPLADWQLRREILPLLEMAGLIIQVQDATDKRKTLIILAKDYQEPGDLDDPIGNLK